MNVSIRARLTLWYTAVLSFVLVASAIGFYVIQWRLRLAQLDEELASAEALVARLVPLELDEGVELAEAASGALEDIEVPGRPVAVFDAAGVQLSGGWEGLPAPAADGLGKEEWAGTVKTPAGAFRLRWAGHQHKEITYGIGAARSLAPVEQELVALRRALLSGVFFALLLAAGGGWWIARGALQPVAVMAAQASQITDRTPGQRLTAANPVDELGQLARAFNDLLARLESALAGQRRFMADASHELRTPVSVARTAAEVTLSQSGRPEDEYRDSLGVVAAQMRRLARIVEDMFLLARADAVGLPVVSSPLYLDELVADCVKEAQMLAAPGEVRVDWAGPGDIEAVGDERLLRQMLMNLLDNAVRHTPSGGWVRVDLLARPEAFEVAVTDSGRGIPKADQERVFERFVRLDESRPSSEGAGLGLAIARAIAEAHGGTLVITRSDASGSTFLVRLPHPERRT